MRNAIILQDARRGIESTWKQGVAPTADLSLIEEYKALQRNSKFSSFNSHSMFHWPPQMREEATQVISRLRYQPIRAHP